MAEKDVKVEDQPGSNDQLEKRSSDAEGVPTYAGLSGNKLSVVTLSTATTSRSLFFFSLFRLAAVTFTATCAFLLCEVSPIFSS